MLTESRQKAFLAEVYTSVGRVSAAADRSSAGAWGGERARSDGFEPPTDRMVS